jgi:hypothetical protein
LDNCKKNTYLASVINTLIIYNSFACYTSFLSNSTIKLSF